MLAHLQDMRMQQPKTPYQVLNVAPDAEPEVIDAAYKVLMKKYHPDKVAGGPPLSESKAAEINDAFRILRDPARRAKHDAEEKARRPVIAGADWAFDPARGGAPFAPKAEPRPGQDPGNRPPPPPSYNRMVVVPPHRKTGRRIVGWSGVIAALLLIGITVAQTQGSGIAAASFSETLQSAAADVGGEGAMLAGRTAVSQQRIAEALVELERVRALYGPVGVAAYSDACFGAQSRSGELSDFDFCVAFDHAASALDTSASEPFRLPPTVRLSEDQLDSRHVGAAKLPTAAYEGLEDRLANIKTMTYTAIARRDDGEDAANAEVPAPAPTASAGSQPRRTVRRAPPRYARSSGSSQPARRSQGGARDAEFLERQGGIY